MSAWPTGQMDQMDQKGQSRVAKNDPFIGGYVGKVAPTRAAPPLIPAALIPGAAQQAQPAQPDRRERQDQPANASMLYTDDAQGQEREPGREQEPEPEREREQDGRADLARRIAGFVPAARARPALPSKPALSRALSDLLLRLRVRFMRLFPEAIRAELESEPHEPQHPDGSEDGESAVRWICTLARAMAELDGTGDERAQHERVMRIVRPGLRKATALQLPLAPWVRASDVRADIADDAAGRGTRILAYALYDATQTGGAAHFAFHEGAWYLLLCATYSARAWHDVYGAMMHVAPDERGADTRLITVYDPTVATIACEVGLRHLRLGPNATVRLARVARLSQGDALALGMHTMCKGNTTPIIPGGHVLAGLREFASDGRGLMHMIEDPYERVFTTFHAKLSAHARTGLVGTSVGASYGKVLVSLFRMFTSTDLDIESGPLCALVRATPNGHCRIVDEASIEELVEQIRDRHKHEDGGIDYACVLYQIVTGQPYTSSTAADGMKAMLTRIENSARTQAKDSTWKSNLGKAWASVRAIVPSGVSIFVIGLGKWGWGTVQPAMTEAELATAAGVAQAAANAATASAGISQVWVGAIAAVLVGIAAVGGLGYMLYTQHTDKERRVTTMMKAVISADPLLATSLPFTALSAELAMLVPATELAYHVMLGVMDVTEIKKILEDKKDVRSPATMEIWARVVTEPNGQAPIQRPRAERAVLLEKGLPSIHAEVDVARGVYWMLVSLFVQTQIQHLDEIVGRYTEHINRAVRGHATESGVAMRTNVTREPRAVQIALDSVPIGACVYGHSASGALAVMRRTALDTFDEYSVKEHDRGIQLEQNTLVHAADLAHRVMQGERLYGPVYDADELLGPRARRTKKRGVFSTTRVTCEFVPHAILPMSFAARGADEKGIEKYAAFLSALRWKQRTLMASKLGSYAKSFAKYGLLGIGGVVTAFPYVKVLAGLGPTSAVPLLVIAATHLLLIGSSDGLGSIQAWVHGTEENKKALFEDARKDIERAPTLYTQLSPALRDAIHGINPEPALGAAAAEDTVLPFDYMSVSSEAMQTAKSTFGVSSAILRQCIAP